METLIFFYYSSVTEYLLAIHICYRCWFIYVLLWLNLYLAFTIEISVYFFLNIILQAFSSSSKVLEAHLLSNCCPIEPFSCFKILSEPEKLLSYVNDEILPLHVCSFHKGNFILHLNSSPFYWKLERFHKLQFEPDCFENPELQYIFSCLWRI